MVGEPVVGEGTRRAARVLVALAVAELAGKVATFVIMVFAARRLGRVGFGSFSFDFAVALLVATLVGWGFDTVVTRAGSRDRAKLAAAYADLVALRLGLIAVALVVTAGAALGEGPGSASLLLLSASTLFDTLSDAGRAVAAAVDGQSRVAAVQVGQRLVTAVLAIGSLVAGGGLLGLCGAFAVGSALGAVGVQQVVRGYGVPLVLAHARWARIRVLLRESFAVGVNTVVSTALFRFDAVLLGLLAGNLAVGRYAAAYRLLETVMFVNWTVAKAVFPSMAASGNPQVVRRGFERGVTVCAFVFAPYSALLLLRGADLMRLLYGPAYAGRGASVLAWLAGAPLAFGIAFLAAYALYALDASRAVLVGSVSALVANTAANLVFIPSGQDLAAAISTTGSYLLEAVVLCALLARATGRPQLGKPLVVPLLAVVPASLVLLLGLPVLVAGVLEGLAYLVVWWLLSSRVDPEGVAVLRSLTSRAAA